MTATTFRFALTETLPRVMALAAILAGAIPSCAQSQSNSSPVLVTRAGGSLAVIGVAASPDGRWFVTQGRTGSVTIRDDSDGHELRTFQAFPANSQPSLPGHIAVAAGSRTIIVAGGNEIHLFDVHTTREIRHFSTNVPAWEIAAHPTKPLLAAIDTAGNLGIISLDDGSGRFHQQLTIRPPLSFFRLHVRFSPDGSLLAASTNYGIQVWDWNNRKKLIELDARAFHSNDLARQVTYQDGGSIKSARAEDRHYFEFTGVSFSPDGRFIALAAEDELTILALPSGKQIARTKIASADVENCAFLDANRVIAMETGAPSITVFTLSTSSANTQNGGPYIQDYVVFPRGDRAFVLGFASYLLDSVNGTVFNLQGADASPAIGFAFTPDGKQLIWDSYQKPLTSWDMDSGEAYMRFGRGIEGAHFTLSRDGMHLTYVSFQTGGIRVVSARTGLTESEIPVADTNLLNGLSSSADSKFLAYSRSAGDVHVISVAERRDIFSIAADKPTDAQIDPGASRLAVADAKGITVYSVDAPRQKLAFIPAATDELAPVAIRFSPDGKLLASMESGALRIFSTDSWALANSIPISIYPSCLEFSPDSARIAFATMVSGVEVRDIATGRLVLKDDSNSTACPVAFSADGRSVMAATEFGANLYSTRNGNLLGSLYLFGLDKGLEWLAVAPNGLFDGTPGAWSQLGWRFANDTFQLAPIEIFFSGFYRPGLLKELFEGDVPAAPADISTIDRRQALLSLGRAGGDATQEITERRISLKIDVAEAPKDSAHPESGSGVRDLRLFRNGSLIRVWRGEIPLAANGKTTLTADDVAVVAGENKFTAYAFSDANIKSGDAEMVVNGASSLQRQPVAYVLAVGINRYAADALQLKFGVNDAADFGETLKSEQAKLGEFAETAVVTLTDAEATKQNILAALNRLAGTETGAVLPEEPAQFAKLRRVQPEDSVFFYFAGHGAAPGKESKRFYFIAQDFAPGHAASDAKNSETLPGAINDIELGRVVERIDARNFVVIIDACQSGETLAADDPRQGPLNSQGLAQLAYEKGMYILAAAQADEAAKELSQFDHGLLTYALVEEGLKQGKADDDPKDGQILLNEWLDYTKVRLPQLQLDGMQRMASLGRSISVAPGANERGVTPDERETQTPRIFYRRDPNAVPLVIARP